MDNLNILIVEDQFLIYTHIKTTLQSFGFKKIDVATNSKKALDIANNKKIDLLFSDIKIDGLVDGIDTALNIQSLYDTPVIFITAYKDEAILKRVSKVNYIGYLLKPYREDELEALIEIAIYKYKLYEKSSLVEYEDYKYCLEEKKLFKNNNEIELSKKEKLFVYLLFSNIDSIISYTNIDNIIWENKKVSENTRRTFIYRFKKRFLKLNIIVEKNIGLGLFNKI